MVVFVYISRVVFSIFSFWGALPSSLNEYEFRISKRIAIVRSLLYHQATQVTSPLPVPPGAGGADFARAHGAGATATPPDAAAGPADAAPPPAAAAATTTPTQPPKSRKEKSLGVLCANFMALYRDMPPNRDNNGTVVEICQVAERLGVARRRIYDVINILESIDIVCRVKKNTYRWHGGDGLAGVFANMQRAALLERAAAAAGGEAAAAAVGVAAADGERPAPSADGAVPPEQTSQQQEQQSSSSAADGEGPAPSADGTVPPEQTSQQQEQQPSSSSSAAAAAAATASTKTKGMAQTCQKLIQIFLVTGRVEISLAEAAEEVLGPLSPAEEADAAKAMKTKVRRMYDIANVLTSIGILSKENVGSTNLQNKPGFRWVYHVLPSDLGNHVPPHHPAAAAEAGGAPSLSSSSSSMMMMMPPPSPGELMGLSVETAAAAAAAGAAEEEATMALEAADANDDGSDAIAATVEEVLASREEERVLSMGEQVEV